MKPHIACLLICTSLILSGCKDEEPTAVEHELVAGRTFNVTRVDGQPLPVVVGRLIPGRVLVCENTPVIRSTISFRANGILELTTWAGQDAVPTISLMTYTQLANGTIQVGDSDQTGGLANGLLTIRLRTGLVCGPYTWEAGAAGS